MQWFGFVLVISNAPRFRFIARYIYEPHIVIASEIWHFHIKIVTFLIPWLQLLCRPWVGNSAKGEPYRLWTLNSLREPRWNPRISRTYPVITAMPKQEWLELEKYSGDNLYAVSVIKGYNAHSFTKAAQQPAPPKLLAGDSAVICGRIDSRSYCNLRPTSSTWPGYGF